MSKNIVYSLVLVFVLMGVFGLAFRVQRVEASGTIYIRSDGLVYPSDAPIDHDGNIYTLTGDINDSIVVKKNDIVIDGAGLYTVHGLGDFDSIGMNLTGRSNVTIRNVKEIKEFGYGVLLNMSSNILIFGSVLSANNRGGIYLSQASNSTIHGNNMTANMNYDVKLSQSSDNELYGNNLRRILIEYSSNNNSVYGNEILVSGQEGVGLGWSANNNVIFRNNIRGGWYGVHVFHASSQKILGNNITETNYGIYLDSSSSNIISRNTVKNTTFGIFLHYCSENTIFHNNFLDNERNALVFDSHINLWDYGFPFGGNYWSNYTGVDSNDDGIGESSHVLDEENRDNYPLMGMFSSFNTSYGYAVDFVSNSSISDFGFNLSPEEKWPPEAILTFNVSGQADAEGFLRVCIPKVLINGSYVVMFNGETITTTTWPQVRELQCSSETYEYLYINYTHSEHAITITGTTTIPEFPSFLILPLFMIATLLAIMIYRRKYIA